MIDEVVVRLRQASLNSLRHALLLAHQIFDGLEVAYEICDRPHHILLLSGRAYSRTDHAEQVYGGACGAANAYSYLQA